MGIGGPQGGEGGGGGPFVRRVVVGDGLGDDRLDGAGGGGGDPVGQGAPGFVELGAGVDPVDQADPVSFGGVQPVAGDDEEQGL